MPFCKRRVSNAQNQVLASVSFSFTPARCKLAVLLARAVTSAPSGFQVGFFKVIIIPLFTAWVGAFPECAPLLDQVTGPAPCECADRDIGKHPHASLCCYWRRSPSCHQPVRQLRTSPPPTPATHSQAEKNLRHWALQDDPPESPGQRHPLSLDVDCGSSAGQGRCCAETN